MHMKIIIFIAIFFTIATQSLAGTKIIDYGYEDWVGWDGDNSPAPGYIHTTDYAVYWQDHMNSTLVVTENAYCGSAYEGSHYFHIQFNTAISDPCLGRTATTTNNKGSIGANGTYPLGSKDTTQFSSITSNTITIRFYFRTSGDWTSNQATIDNGGGLKFIRLYAGDGAEDDSSILLKMTNDGDSTDPLLKYYNPSNYTLIDFRSGVNFQDGGWHSIVLRVVRNNDTNSTDNITMTTWIDDWGMAGAGYSGTITVPDADNNYTHMELAGNWSVQSADELMSMDIDKFEIWDGLPDTEASPSTTIITSGTTPIVSGTTILLTE
jgi:hypothetical protein